MAETLNTIYFDAGHPASFSTARKLYDAASKVDATISLKFVKNWLATQLPYTLHKPKRKVFPRSRVVVTDKNVQWQADLVDLQNYSRFNKGQKYLLTVIDVFSKYAWVIPLKTKSGIEVTEAFQSIFEKDFPSNIQTDNGKEFKNSELQKLFKQFNINFFTTTDEDIKCSLVERFNRTLKEKMFKIMTKTGKRNYLEFLPSIVSSYNNSVHSATGFKPIDVGIEDKDVIFRRLYGYKDRRELLIKQRKKKITPKLNEGDLVRIRYQGTKFERVFYPNWSDEIYEVIKQIKADPPYYILKDYQNQVIDGRFYEQEVQKVLDPKYRVETVIKRRTRNGIRECFVKWLNFSSSHNQWIPEADIESV